MKRGEGMWSTLDPTKAINYAMGGDVNLGNTCDTCGDTYWPIRSSDRLPICDGCKENFKKFVKAQRKVKLLDHE